MKVHQPNEVIISPAVQIHVEHFEELPHVCEAVL